MKKRILSLILALTLVLGLAASCAKESTPDEPKEGNTPKNSQNADNPNPHDPKDANDTPPPAPKGNNDPPTDWPEIPLSDFTYSYDANTQGVSIDKYKGSAMKVRIPDEIEGEPVTRIGYEAFRASGIMSVYVPNSVTVIGSHAFSNCKGLTGIVIPDNVIEIGKETFRHCTGLTGVILPEGLTKIGGSAFAHC